MWGNLESCKLLWQFSNHEDGGEPLPRWFIQMILNLLAYACKCVQLVVSDLFHWLEYGIVVVYSALTAEFMWGWVGVRVPLHSFIPGVDWDQSLNRLWEAEGNSWCMHRSICFLFFGIVRGQGAVATASNWVNWDWSKAGTTPGPQLVKVGALPGQGHETMEQLVSLADPLLHPILNRCIDLIQKELQILLPCLLSNFFLQSWILVLKIWTGN